MLSPLLLRYCCFYCFYCFYYYDNDYSQRTHSPCPSLRYAADELCPNLACLAMLEGRAVRNCAVCGAKVAPRCVVVVVVLLLPRRD